MVEESPAFSVEDLLSVEDLFSVLLEELLLPPNMDLAPPPKREDPAPMARLAECNREDEGAFGGMRFRAETDPVVLFVDAAV